MVSTDQEETKKLSPDELLNYVDTFNKESRPPAKDSYSIGELARLHEIDELVIRPSYQRLFRWNEEDESAFIESLLLKYPVPPIFVSIDGDGVYEVIDGLQRLSTVLHFLGKVSKINKKEPLVLEGLKKLERLNGISFADLPKTLQRDFERTSLQLNILQRLDGIKAHEVFIRLNRNGRPLTAQEVRNAILDDLNLLDKLKELKVHPLVEPIFLLREKEIQEAYDDELLLRYLFCRFCKKNPELQSSYLKKHATLENILDEFVLKHLSLIDLNEELRLFSRTLYLLDGVGEDGQALADFDINRQRSKKNVRSLSMFMIVLTSVSLALEEGIDIKPSHIELAIKRYWERGNQLQGLKAYRIIQEALKSVDTFMEDITRGTVS